MISLFEIEFYEKADGTAPVKEFLESLDIKMRAKMLMSIELLKYGGYQLREPYSKSLDDGILELRAKSGNNISRVLYFFVIGETAVLTNGFIKKTTKTPKNEIECASNTERIISIERSTAMTNYNKFFEEQMKDAAFRKEWEALQPEMAIVKAMLDARKKTGMTQKELSEKTGIAQADISRLETGNANPSLKTLQRLAEGMGMTLKLEFIPAV